MTLANLLRCIFFSLPAAPAVWCDAAQCETAPATQLQPEAIVLIHGLGRTTLSMRRMERELEKQGYHVLNFTYPSTRLPIERAAELLDRTVTQHALDRAPRLHFVTHSLGGIVLRQYLKVSHPWNLGRVVMLAPPNHGSELVDRLKENLFFKLFTGPAAQQLGTDPMSMPARLGPATFDVGVMAGDRSLNPLFSACIPGPADGKVPVASTQLDGMRDFLLVHHTHTWMTWRMEVIRAVVCYLQTGRFRREPGSGQ
jgi:triacylglycerol lipase